MQRYQMILDINNPKVDISKATNVYAMYTWIGKWSKQPCAELILMTSNYAMNVAELIEEVKAKPSIHLHNSIAKLHVIYVDGQ